MVPVIMDHLQDQYLDTFVLLTAGAFRL